MKHEVEIWLRICVPFACLRNLNVTLSWPFLFLNGSVPRLLLFRCGEYNVKSFRSGEEELEKEIWGDCKRDVWLCCLLFSSHDPNSLGGGGSVYNQHPSFPLDPSRSAHALLWEDRPSTVRSGNMGPQLPRKSQPVTAAPGIGGKGQNQHWSLLVPFPASH